MAISYVGAGTRSTAAGASTSPALPGSLQTDDLLVLVDVLVRQGSGAPGTVTTPSGWTAKTTVVGTTNVVRITLLYRRYAAGVTAPTVSYSGPVSSDGHYSRIYAFRGAAATGDPTDVLGAVSSNSASTTNLGPITGVTTTIAGGAALVVGVREDETTSATATYATLTGDSLTWAEVEDVDLATSGDGVDDYGVATDYALVPTARTITNKTFAVTSGSSCAGTGIMWSLKPVTTQTVTATGIDSAEAFGTASLAPVVAPTGIGSDEALGTPALTQQVQPTGLDPAEAFGTAVLVPGNVSVGPAGAIGSEEAVPAPVVSPAPVTVSPGGIGTAEALGILVITTGQAIQPGGIGPAEAFGTPVLIPGSVAVGPAGVGSVEAFGGPALAPVVQPTGIASGGAFGTAALAQTVVVAGIGSGEAIGAPTAAPGPVTAAPTGIASGGAFGTARLDLTILPVGLASGGAFGTAELLRGAVSLAPTGIPSTEAFGSPALYARIAPPGIPTAEALGTPQLNLRIYPVGIASEEVFGATGGEEVELAPRRIPQRLLARYELVCVARIPQTTGAPALLAVDPVDWSSLTWAEELSRPQTLSATCKISKLTDPVIQRLQTPHELPTELWLYRNGKLIVAGPMLGWSVSGEEVTIEAQGLLAYAFMMFVTADLVYSATDQFAIVRGLLDHWQNLEYGNFGLDTSEPSLSGFVRDATFLKKELTNVGKAITDLSAGADGFDVLIDPASRKLQLFYPRQGIDRSTGEDAIVFDSRNVTSSNVTCSIAPGDVATESIGTGSNTAGEGLYATAANLELRAKYGRSAVAATFDSADQATLDSQVGGLLNARDQVLLIPGTNTRVTVDADLASYDIGDTISYQLHGRLSVQSAFRIRKRSVSVAQTGTEAVSFEFA